VHTALSSLCINYLARMPVVSKLLTCQKLCSRVTKIKDGMSRGSLHFASYPGWPTPQLANWKELHQRV